MNASVESFIEIAAQRSEQSLWEEQRKEFIIRAIENNYNIDLLKYYGITDIVINGGKVLVKWEKREIPLEDDSLERRYGK